MNKWGLFTALSFLLAPPARASGTTQAVYCDDSAAKNTACTLSAAAAGSGGTGIAGLQANSSFFDPCCTVFKDGLAPMEQMITQTVGDYYLGKVRDPSSNTTPITYLTGMSFPTPTCNQANARLGSPSSSLPQNENATNYLGQSCGASCRFQCALASDAQPLLGADCQITAKTCGSEQAWTRGAFVELVWSKMAEVEGELRGRNLNVSNQCLPVLSATSVVFAKLQTTLQAWTAYWQKIGKTPPPIPTGCGTDDLTSAAGTASGATGNLTNAPFVAGNLLCAARKQLEGFPFRIGACESLARAENAWAQGTALGILSAVVPAVLKQPFQTCADQSTLTTTDKKGKTVFKTLDPQKLSTCMTSAYVGAIAPAFKAQTPPKDPGPAYVPLLKASIPLALTTSPVLSCVPGINSGNSWEPVTCGVNASPAGPPFASTELAIEVNAGDGLDLTLANLNTALAHLSTGSESTYQP